MLARLGTLLLISVITLTSSAQQQPAVVLSQRAQVVKDKISSLSIQDHISVIPIHGEEQFAAYLSKDDASFTFYDVDRKMNATLMFTEVKKVKNGYGGYNYFNQRHTDRTDGLIVIGLVVAVLGGLLAAVASAKN